jgi:hypothetical protein
MSSGRDRLRDQLERQAHGLRGAAGSTRPAPLPWSPTMPNIHRAEADRRGSCSRRGKRSFASWRRAPPVTDDSRHVPRVAARARTLAQF